MLRHILATGAAVIAFTLPDSVALAKAQTAIFAGGCFWSVESDFGHVPGVISMTAGYIGGTSDHPTYEDHENAGHREAVKIEFDDARISYAQMLDAYWHSIDPTDHGGQFCDRGHSYTTAIYATGKEQLALATKSKAVAATQLKQPLATEIAMAPTFWPAEDYHQHYARKNPVRYSNYRVGCGRDAQVERVWGATAYHGMEAGH
ncbi:peptide-methionine (S)-S-oxide reductase MsrA [Pseudaminobacter salicylatoxidans]|uniref:peptide-methionine (S)-S-oxide reductase MsrA n=1 Tax=Pseudaminobacter salicylatoxidans TaxID=93369 RepID=UPI0002E15FC7|nr:peptide-methionine (S)-S-oxide reductase MsrA [Pseudaminobacter salicylatoxidans]